MHVKTPRGREIPVYQAEGLSPADAAALEALLSPPLINSLLATHIVGYFPFED